MRKKFTTSGLLLHLRTVQGSRLTVANWPKSSLEIVAYWCTGVPEETIQNLIFCDPWIGKVNQENPTITETQYTNILG